MRVDVALLPKDLTDDLLLGRSVVVFDVLRATSSIVTAIASGASRVRVFADHQSMRDAANCTQPRPLLAGETKCVRPAGFDLGNSPCEHADPRVTGREIFLSTTNGTRAIHASLRAKRIFVGSLLNARAVAHELLAMGDDVTLVCAGTQGEVAEEDRCGAGAVTRRMLEEANRTARLLPSQGTGDRETSEVAHPLRLGGSLALQGAELFDRVQADLPQFLRSTTGGRNIIEAGLAPDIDWCARLDSIDVIPRATVEGDAVFITR